MGPATRAVMPPVSIYFIPASTVPRTRHLLEAARAWASNNCAPGNIWLIGKLHSRILTIVFSFFSAITAVEWASWKTNAESELCRKSTECRMGCRENRKCVYNTPACLQKCVKPECETWKQICLKGRTRISFRTMRLTQMFVRHGSKHLHGSVLWKCFRVECVVYKHNWDCETEISYACKYIFKSSTLKKKCVCDECESSKDSGWCM